MTTTCPRMTQSQPIILIHIGLRCGAQGQCAWWIDLWMIGRFAIHQPMQEIEDVGFCRHACLQSHFHSAQNSLLIVLQNQGPDV